MKRKVLSLLTVFTLLIASFFIPALIDKRVVSVEIVGVKTATYSNDIYVNGVVEERSKKDVTVKIPLVANKINCEVGDTVYLNEILAEIDVDATVEALLDLTQLKSLVPAEYVEAAASLSFDTEMLKQYIPTVIISPADGIITSMSITKGSICMPTTPLFSVSNQDDIRLKLSVSENDVGRVNQGDTVVFKATASGDKKYLGTVDVVFPSANKTIIGTSQATVVNMYVKPINSYPELKPGFTVSGVVKSTENVSVSVLPYECIMQDANNSEYVYIAGFDGVYRCDITTGRELSDGVEVTSPILDSQRVIANPSDIKTEKDLIRIVKER